MLSSSLQPQFGKYRLLDVLGMGGMATVYLASLEGLGGFKRKCALKVIHPHLTQDESYIRWFINEARLGGFLQHQHIVQALEFGEEQGCLFLAMEYVDGTTLSRILHHADTLPFRIPLTTVGEILEAILKGLSYAHQATDTDERPLRLIHRDLKPANILIGKHGAIKIADFGVARADSNLSITADTGIIKGTARYMSPEQARGTRQIDQRSDLFSVGALAYELLTQTRLYSADNTRGVHQQALEADNRVALALLERDPERGDFAPFLRRALAVRPEDRFQSASEMLMAWERLRPNLMSGPSLMPWLEDSQFSWSSSIRKPTLTLLNVGERPATPGEEPALETQAASLILSTLSGASGVAAESVTVAVLPDEAARAAQHVPVLKGVSAPPKRVSSDVSPASGSETGADVGHHSPARWRLVYVVVALLCTSGIAVWAFSGAKGTTSEPTPLNSSPLSPISSAPRELGAMPDTSPNTPAAQASEVTATSALPSSPKPLPIAAPVAASPQAGALVAKASPKVSPPALSPRSKPIPAKAPPPEEVSTRVAPVSVPGLETPAKAVAKGYLTFNVPDLGSARCQLDEKGMPKLRWIKERLPAGPHTITCRDEGWDKSYPVYIEADQHFIIVCRRNGEGCRARIEPLNEAGETRP